MLRRLLMICIGSKWQNTTHTVKSTCLRGICAEKSQRNARSQAPEVEGEPAQKHGLRGVHRPHFGRSTEGLAAQELQARAAKRNPAYIEHDDKLVSN